MSLINQMLKDLEARQLRGGLDNRRRCCGSRRLAGDACHG